MASDRGDEPEEGDARKRNDVQADQGDAAALLLEVEICDLLRVRSGVRPNAQREYRDDEEHREDQAYDAGCARRLQPVLDHGGLRRIAVLGHTLTVADPSRSPLAPAQDHPG